MKTLYSFKHKIPSSGEIINLAIKKPTRLELDETDMFYSQIISECVSRGILTKEMMLKKYVDFGGVMSKKESKEYNNSYQKFLILSQEIEQCKNEKKRAKLEENRLEHYLVLQDVESEQEKLFDRTADVIARNKVMLYLVFLLAQTDKDDDSFEPVFGGESHEDRYESFAEKEEKDPDDAHAMLAHFSYLIYFWYYGDKDISENDFKAYEAFSEYMVQPEPKVIKDDPEELGKSLE